MFIILMSEEKFSKHDTKFNSKAMKGGKKSWRKRSYTDLHKNLKHVKDKLAQSQKLK